MQGSRLWMTVCVLAVLLAFPRTGSAGLWDFIVEMSGPQLAGGVSGCLLDLDGTLHHCSIAGFPVQKGENGGLDLGWPLKYEPPHVWFFLHGGTYISTGLDPGKDFKFGHAYMVSADPMFAFRTKFGKYHAVGATLNLIASQDFRRVGNYGLKLQPVTWHMLGSDWEVTLRMYKNGFDVVEGSDPTVLVKGKEFETVLGFGASIPIFR